VSPIAHRSLVKTFFPAEETLLGEIRFPLWKNALALVKEFPVLGSGLGTFNDVFLRYRPTEMPQDRQAVHAHNDYLELLIEMGIPGLLIALWAIFRFFRYVLRGYFEHGDPVLVSLTLGGLTSCAAILIHSFFDFNLHIPANALLFFIVLAMTIVTVQLMARGHGKEREARAENQSAKRNGFSVGGSKIYHFTPSWIFSVGVIGVIGILVFNFRENIAMVYYSRAKTVQYQDQLFQAIVLYKKAMAIDGGDALFHEALAELYRDLGRKTPYAEKWYNLAVQEYKNAISLNIYNPVYYYYLGWTYVALDMEAEAVQAFRKAIASDPRISFYYENLGRYFLSIAQVEAALKVYQKAVQLNPQKIPEILKVCKEYGLSITNINDLFPKKPKVAKCWRCYLFSRETGKPAKLSTVGRLNYPENNRNTIIPCLKRAVNVTIMNVCEPYGKNWGNNTLITLISQSILLKVLCNSNSGSGDHTISSAAYESSRQDPNPSALSANLSTAGT